VNHEEDSKIKMHKAFVHIINFLFVLIVNNNSFCQVNFVDSNLPIIVIQTNGQSIVDEPKITCDMGVIWNEDGSRNFLSDPFNEYDGKIGIEIRGSTSQQYPKKSYGFETRDALGNNLNTELLGLPKENDWVLYGAFPDKSLMRNEITYSLFEKMQPWSPRYVYCELVIDNEYLGIYTLIEKVKRDNDRIDIAEIDEDDLQGDSLTGGYVVKIDKLTGSSNTPWISDYQDELKFLYHDPKFEELKFAQREYIKNYISDFEDAVYGPQFKDPVEGYRPFIDVNSFFDFMLMQELGRTVDGYRSSSFMYKDRNSKGGKLTCGPMWDFNLSYGNADYCDGFLTTGWQYNFEDVCGDDFDVAVPNWWKILLEDPSFVNALKCRWIELRSTILSDNYIENWIDSTANYLNEAQERNFIKWPILGEYINWNYFIGDSFQEEVNYLKWWFKTRSEYLDSQLPGVCNTINSTYDNGSIILSTTLFPNPTSKFLSSTIPFKNTSKIKIFNMIGEPVQFELVGEKIDLSNLPQGMYLIHVFEQYIKVFKMN